MKEETKKYIEELITKDFFANPSAITSCIFLFRVDRGLEDKMPYGLLRSLVIKEMDRVKKKHASLPERPKEPVC